MPFLGKSYKKNLNSVISSEPKIMKRGRTPAHVDYAIDRTIHLYQTIHIIDNETAIHNRTSNLTIASITQ